MKMGRFGGLISLSRPGQNIFSLWAGMEREVKRVSKTLYVGNLPWATTRQDLADFFSNAVPVLAVRVIVDRETGRSRGFGFIEVEDEDAERAIEAMNGRNLGGREIIVNEARPRPDK